MNSPKVANDQLYYDLIYAVKRYAGFQFPRDVKAEKRINERMHSVLVVNNGVASNVFF